MIAIKKTVTVEEPDRIVLSGLPFRPGQRVEVVVLAKEARPRPRPRALRSLLRRTQRISALKPVTPSQIEREIAAYRVGQWGSSSTRTSSSRRP